MTALTGKATQEMSALRGDKRKGETYLVSDVHVRVNGSFREFTAVLLPARWN
jgi:hypothetical protein